MYRQHINIEAPTDAANTGTATAGKEMSKEDILEALNADDADEPIELEKPAKKEAKSEDEDDKKVKALSEEDDEKEDDEDDEDDEEKKEDDDEDLDELEDELEDPDEKKLELVTPVRRKEILKAYPDLFKKFPYLEKAYYREQQFTEIYPTIDDAKAAAEGAETLRMMESDLMEGNSEVVLTAIKNQDQNSFHKLVDNFMPTLQKLDEKAYLHIISNNIKMTIHAMATKANELGDEGDPLMKAATILNQFVFNTNKYEAPKNLAAEKTGTDDKETKLAAERRDFNRQRFETSRTEINTKINNVIKATIEANIDPKKSMSDYLRKNAIRDAQDDIGRQLMKDARFKVIVDKLWEKAIRENYSKASTDAIKSAFTSRARTLLLPVIKKARNEALKGMGKRTSDSSEEPAPSARRSTVDEPSSKRTGKITNAKDIPKGMSSRDFLMMD